MGLLKYLAASQVDYISLPLVMLISTNVCPYAFLYIVLMPSDI